jgi:arginine decarboxylase
LTQNTKAIVQNFYVFMISTVDHRRTPLLDALFQQAQLPHRRFYMPGHKGGKGSPASLIQALGNLSLNTDIPELPNLDQLFAPSGVIQSAQELAADAFGAEKTHFLINGSSTGLMAALMTVCHPGEQIILPRNCHQSIVHGLILSGAHPIWIHPSVEPESYLHHCITPPQLQAALEEFPKAKGAIAVSPTYEGVCGDIQGLAAIAHDHNIPLIVDEAHGAHFRFHPDLPPSALSQGADLVVQSTHKVLGALTQASMLHVKGDRISRDALHKNLTILQSSSPNYLLLASLDAARSQMAIDGETILTEALKISAIARERLQQLKTIQVLRPAIQVSNIKTTDPLRLTLITTQSALSGFELDEILNRQYGIIAEFPAAKYLCFVLGQGNTHNELQMLCDALENIEAKYPRITPSNQSKSTASDLLFPKGCTCPPHRPREIHYSPSKSIKLENAIGQISAELICPYPPGIPLIFPGEIITADVLAKLRNIRRLGGKIIGPQDSNLESLNIIEQTKRFETDLY